MKLEIRIDGTEDSDKIAHKIYDWCVAQGYHVKHNDAALYPNRPIYEIRNSREDGGEYYCVIAINFHWITDEQINLFRLRWGA